MVRPGGLSIKETAEYFGVSERTIDRWIAHGRLSAYRIGPRLLRIRRESITSLGQTVKAA